MNSPLEIDVEPSSRDNDGPILAIDTATNNASVALCDGATVLAERAWASHRRQTVELAPAVREILAEADVSPHNLAGIAVAIGPGSYTGLRIGLAFAKGLALVSGAPLFGIVTLDGLALSLARWRAERDATLIAVLRAGRGRFTGLQYALDESLKRDRKSEIESMKAMPLEQLAAESPQGAWIAGELDLDERDWLVAQGFFVPPEERCVRRAVWLAEIARSRLIGGDIDDPATLTPIYPGGSARPGPKPAVVRSS